MSESGCKDYEIMDVNRGQCVHLCKMHPTYVYDVNLGKCVSCQANEVRLDNLCVCTKGYYLVDQTCTMCDANSIKPEIGNDQCAECVPYEKANDNRTFCISKCYVPGLIPDKYYAPSGNCESCPPNMVVGKTNECECAVDFKADSTGGCKLAALESSLSEAQTMAILIGVFTLIVHVLFIVIWFVARTIRLRRWKKMGAKSA